MGLDRLVNTLPFSVLSLFLLCSCAGPGSGPVKAMETTVPLVQLDNVARDVQGWHNGQYPKCTFDSVVTTKIVKQEKDTVNEAWTIRACEGRTFTYAVLVIHASVGISDAISNIDGRPFHVE